MYEIYDEVLRQWVTADPEPDVATVLDKYETVSLGDVKWRMKPLDIVVLDKIESMIIQARADNLPASVLAREIYMTFRGNGYEV